MSKKAVVKKPVVHEHEHSEDCLHFDDMDDAYDAFEPGAVEMIDKVMDSANHQVTVALELTRLVYKNETDTVDGKEVLATFKEACAVVAEYHPVQKIIEQLGS